MKRIVFVNKYFYPDHSATSQILTDLTSYLASNGFQVVVICSQQIYDDPSAGLPAQETLAGVEVHRVATTRRGRAGIAGRVLDYMAFYAAAAAKVRRVVGRDDIVVIKSDPPLLSAPIGYAARRQKARVVNWLQDLYPEVAVELGVRALRGARGKVMASVRNRSLRKATANVVIGEKMAGRLRKLGVDPSRLHVITNWADPDTVVSVPREANRFRHEWGLKDKFVVGYSGNLGRAHEIETVLGAAERLRDEPDLVFLIVGGGHLRPKLEALVRDRGLNNFVFRGYQPRSALSESLSVADVHWLSLLPQLEGLIVPSKFYGIAAAGRPVVAVSATDGEVANLVRKYDLGVVVENGDAAGFASAIIGLKSNPDILKRQGANARRYLETNASMAIGLRRWRELLDSLSVATSKDQPNGEEVRQVGP